MSLNFRRSQEHNGTTLDFLALGFGLLKGSNHRVLCLESLGKNSMETWLVFQKHKQEPHLLRQECGALSVSYVG